MTDSKSATTTDPITPERDDDYQAVVRFTASPETVFEALTTIAGLAGWWAPVSGAGTEGGELHFLFSGAARIEGLILAEDLLLLRVDEARRPSSVRWTVLECGFLPDWVGTSLSFELVPHGDGGCEARFRHHGLTPRLECYTSCAPGWDYHLASLHDYVELGQGRPFGAEKG